MNLDKIKLYCILHNVTRWEGVPSCTDCVKHFEDCRNKGKVEYFKCERKKGNSGINLFTFSMSDPQWEDARGAKYLIFYGCDEYEPQTGVDGGLNV